MRALVQFFNQKEYDAMSQWDGAYCTGPIRYMIPRDRVRVLVDAYSRLTPSRCFSDSLGFTPEEKKGLDTLQNTVSSPGQVESKQFGPKVWRTREISMAVPVEEVSVSGGDRREMTYRRADELRSLRVWKGAKHEDSKSHAAFPDTQKSRRDSRVARSKRRRSESGSSTRSRRGKQRDNSKELRRRSSISAFDGPADSDVSVEVIQKQSGNRNEGMADDVFPWPYNENPLTGTTASPVTSVPHLQRPSEQQLRLEVPIFEGLTQVKQIDRYQEMSQNVDTIKRLASLRKDRVVRNSRPVSDYSYGSRHGSQRASLRVSTVTARPHTAELNSIGGVHAQNKPSFLLSALKVIKESIFGKPRQVVQKGSRDTSAQST